MTAEALVSGILLAVFLLFSVLARLLGRGQEAEQQTEDGIKPAASEALRLEPRASRRLEPPASRRPQKQPPRDRRMRQATEQPRRSVTHTRLSAARRLGVTGPRGLRRAVVLMTLLGPCRALESTPYWEGPVST